MELIMDPWLQDAIDPLLDSHKHVPPRFDTIIYNDRDKFTTDFFVTKVAATQALLDFHLNKTI